MKYTEMMNEGTIFSVTQGYCKEDESTTQETLEAALKIANDDNFQVVHPDHYAKIYLDGKEVTCVCNESDIIGFIR